MLQCASRDATCLVMGLKSFSQLTHLSIVISWEINAAVSWCGSEHQLLQCCALGCLWVSSWTSQFVCKLLSKSTKAGVAEVPWGCFGYSSAFSFLGTVPLFFKSPSLAILSLLFLHLCLTSWKWGSISEFTINWFILYLSSWVKSRILETQHCKTEYIRNN